MNTIVQHNSQQIAHKSTLTGGQLANEQASQAAFSLYRMKKAGNTTKAQSRALKRFGRFLTAHYGERFTEYEDHHALYIEPQSWACITWGYVTAYGQWLLSEGEAVATINQHLSVIRVYAGMAFQADVLSSYEERKISKVSGIQGSKQKENVNAKRVKSDERKSVNTLSRTQVRALESMLVKVDTPTGRRDMLLFECLFRHGMRASEVLILTSGSFDLDNRIVCFKRPKIAKIARHDLEQKTINRFNEYMAEIEDDSPFWQSSKRGGQLSGKPLTRSSLHRAVEKWGKRMGIERLSAHDGRHSIATILANKIQGSKEQKAFKLLAFFGWSSITTAQRYVERASIGNKGMKNVF